MNYFVVGTNGERFGPASVDELNKWATEGRVNTTTMVVAEGLTDMMLISNVPGFRLEAVVIPPVNNFQYPRQGIPNNLRSQYLVKAILATLFCCLPVGIVAIVYAAKVDSLSRSGDIYGAEDAARKANLWANWSIGLSLTGTFLYIILIVVLGATGNLK
jgi:hypothetical protein